MGFCILNGLGPPKVGARVSTVEYPNSKSIANKYTLVVTGKHFTTYLFN